MRAFVLYFGITIDRKNYARRPHPYSSCTASFADFGSKMRAKSAHACTCASHAKAYSQEPKKSTKTVFVSQERPKSSQERPESAQEPPKSAQERPRAAQERPKSSQERPKSDLWAVLGRLGLPFGPPLGA